MPLCKSCCRQDVAGKECKNGKKKTYKMSSEITKLNIITYLVPDVKVEAFQVFTEYLEDVANVRCNLIYETRWQYPTSKRDLFDLGDVDMGFISAPGFLEMLERPNSIELCPVAPVYTHPHGRGRPVIFSDVVVRNELGGDYNEFERLKGHKFTYSHPESTTGYSIMLSELKNHNTDSSFFADTIQSGSHLNSLHLLLTKRADVATIDSRFLTDFFSQHPHYKKELKVMTTLGPMPVNPLVFRKTLPSDVKKTITKALLEMPQNPTWNQKLQNLHIENMISIDSTFFDMERLLQEKVKNIPLVPTYY
ncbi:uncharacterized protein LOC115224559 isoform X1 [Octopus sinensis]|uniref:Uncharacterized protein LOC115224559 isoform X1 n=2 Tax=Octopus sinensis TaxID=2607531 RepID=A0A7E6FMZ6_9MOLL|nr:uncharacterized protein LOC115224559 isoform X1 [Octopus sinensis]